MSSDADRSGWFRCELIKAIEYYGGSVDPNVSDEGLISKVCDSMKDSADHKSTPDSTALLALRATIKFMLKDHGIAVADDVTNEGLIRKLTEIVDRTPDGSKIILRGEILGELNEIGIDVAVTAPDSAIVDAVRQLALDFTKLKSATIKAWGHRRDPLKPGDPLFRFCNCIQFLGYGAKGGSWHDLMLAAIKKAIEEERL